MCSHGTTNFRAIFDMPTLPEVRVAAAVVMRLHLNEPWCGLEAES